MNNAVIWMHGQSIQLDLLGFKHFSPINDNYATQGNISFQKKVTFGHIGTIASLMVFCFQRCM